VEAAATGIVGIGYEVLDLEQFVARLLGNRIDVLADVRLTPISRKRGFSKTALGEAVSTAGVEYVHLSERGTRGVRRFDTGCLSVRLAVRTALALPHSPRSEQP
jgi:uncharacterized protein (DUF488 family)